MPLPKPTEGESERAFVGRCMADTTMRREFPRQDQRAGVCYAQYRRGKEKKE